MAHRFGSSLPPSGMFPQPMVVIPQTDLGQDRFHRPCMSPIQPQAAPSQSQAQWHAHGQQGVPSSQARSPQSPPAHDANSSRIQPCQKPVAQKPQPQYQASSPNLSATAKAQPSKKRKLAAVEEASTPPKPGASISNYHLLLSLAEEYIGTAHALGSKLALSGATADDEEKYYKLMATGLGCIESVLKNFSLAPRQHAHLQLHYASLLLQETENDYEVETLLSKGIIFCERHRLPDIKYSMHQVFVRLMSKTNKRAALKYLDDLIPKIKAYQHTIWVYHFRFLRVSLALQATPQIESSIALQDLRAISALAHKLGDTAVYVTCAVIEAITHIRSSSPSAVEQAQGAIATARSYQLHPSIQKLPQIAFLLEIVDLVCSLQPFNPAQAKAKMRTMQALLESPRMQSDFEEDGSFLVPLDSKSESSLTESTAGILRRRVDGRACLAFTWIRYQHLHALGYYLSGVTMFYQNANDGHKAEQYLQQGILMTEDTFTQSDKFLESLPTASARLAWRRELNSRLHLQLTFALCSRTKWAEAESSLRQLQHTVSASDFHVSEHVTRLTTYLTGVIHQGTGDLSSALAVYESETLALPPTDSRTTAHRHDIAILAALNASLILRDQSHPQHARAEALLTALEPLCASHPDQNITAAFHLVKATAASARSSSIKTKEFLQSALTAAKATSNSQLMAMVLNFLFAKFFTNIVGEAAEKAGLGARSMAKKAGDALWESVADGMVSGTLERQGKGEEAREVREQGVALVEGMPDRLKEKFRVGDG